MPGVPGKEIGLLFGGFQFSQCPQAQQQQVRECWVDERFMWNHTRISYEYDVQQAYNTHAVESYVEQTANNERNLPASVPASIVTSLK